MCINLHFPGPYSVHFLPSLPGLGALEPMGVIGGTVSMTNFVDALCLLLSLVIMLLQLAHRPTWPLTKRPTYAANRKQIIQNTDLLGAVGTMLILYAFPNRPVIQHITQFLPKLKRGVGTPAYSKPVSAHPPRPRAIDPKVIHLAS
jgi:hypothetical protein